MAHRPKPRPPRRLLLLPHAVAPLLLLVPLGVLKWRLNWIAEHPPLTKMDQELRATVASASRIHVEIEGPVIGGSKVAFDIKDQTLTQELTAALRCKESGAFEQSEQLQSRITLYVVRPGRERYVTRFLYFHYEKGSVLQYWSPLHSYFDSAAVRDNFAPRFEALIANLAQRAKAPGKHPEIALSQTIP